MTPAPVRFSVAEAEAAHAAWGANCGPTALAAVLGLTLDQVRPAIPRFEERGYTNPTMMQAALDELSRGWRQLRLDEPLRYGLCRVQWGGPWFDPGVPVAATYRHTHWVGYVGSESQIYGMPIGRLWPVEEGAQVFDVNALCAGGWIPMREWADELVPWLLRETTPRASGEWWFTHRYEVQHAA